MVYIVDVLAELKPTKYDGVSVPNINTHGYAAFVSYMKIRVYSTLRS